MPSTKALRDSAAVHESQPTPATLVSTKKQRHRHQHQQDQQPRKDDAAVTFTAALALVLLPLTNPPLPKETNPIVNLKQIQFCRAGQILCGLQQLRAPLH